tara:strand:+ start:1166 stop:3868 length:2703 start_codon:yes stop_codon:yes gene_type:complete
VRINSKNQIKNNTPVFGKSTSWKKRVWGVFFLSISLLVIYNIILILITDNYPKLTKSLQTERISVGNTSKNFLLSHKSPIDNLSIDIKFNHWQKLVKDRNVALEKGYRQCEENCFVPAEMKSNSSLPYKIELRLKGALTDHLNTDKWSFRINIKDTDAYFKGMKRFSLQSPHTRGYHFEPLFMDHISFEGVLAPRYDFVNLIINGENIGVMAIEEAPSKELLEHQYAREGVMFEYEKNSSVLYRRKNDNSSMKLNWRKAPISVFNEKKVLSITDLRKYRLMGKQMLKGLQDGTVVPSQIFDVEQVAKFLAISSLWSSWHSVEWEEMRFYLNPVTLKFEFVASDASLHLNHETEDGPIHDYLVRRYISYPLLSDPLIQKAFIAEIQRITKDDYIVKLIKYLKDKEKLYLSKLHKEYYALPPFNPEYIKNRATTLSKLSKDNIDSFEWLSEIKLQNGITCNNPKFVNAYSGDIFPIDINAYIHSDKENSFIEINNTLFSPDSCKNPQFPVSKPLHVTGITLKNGITVRDDTSYPIILEPEGSPAIVHINIPESSRGKIVEGYITTKGRDNPFNFKAEEAYVEPLKSTTLTDINISYLLEKYPFFQKEADQLSIDRGVYKINEPLILPRGINLNISAGTTITFSSDAFIHLRGELNINGTEQEPVILKGNKGEVWKGIAVIGSKNRSKILYTNVQDITFTELGQWKLTGGITFYESDVDIINSKISRSTSEDAINIIRSDFTVKNTDITDALSDAIDSDFSKGFITDSTFSSIKGDGIDTSGSKITIERVKISNVGDKAISVGEESIVFINDIIVDSTKIAIASKDASEVELNKAFISNISKAAFMSYIKKKEYGTSASLLADNIVFGVNVKHKAIAEKNTFISVNGNIVERDGDEKNARTKK